MQFAIETWEDLSRDAEEKIFPLHAEELAVDLASMKAVMDHKTYKMMQDVGMLLVVTARVAGKLVGYFVGMIMKHHHYVEAGDMLHTDMYYLLPEYRKGGAGAKLLLYVESVLRKKGVVKFYISTKVHEDHSELLESLGFRYTDKMFNKLLVKA